MKKNRSKTVEKVAPPKLEDFSQKDMKEIYQFSKAFYNTTAFDEEVERELEKLEAEKKLKLEKQNLRGRTARRKTAKPPVALRTRDHEVCDKMITA